MNIKKRKAFTLIELLVVIVIVGILSGVGISSYNSYISKAKYAKKIAENRNRCSESLAACTADGRSDCPTIDVCMASIPAPFINFTQAFPDSSFRSRIKSSLNKSESDITEEDVNNLNDASFVFAPISNITGVGHLTSFGSISFYGNKIVSIPEEIVSLKNLDELNLNRVTTLKKLPNSIGEMNNLKSLRLSSTKVESLPSSFVRLKNFETLNLSNSSIKSLPSAGADGFSIDTLNVQNTDVSCQNAIDAGWNVGTCTE